MLHLPSLVLLNLCYMKMLLGCIRLKTCYIMHIPRDYNARWRSCGTVYCNRSCLIVYGCVCLFVCGSVTMITRNCMHHPHQTGFVSKGGDHLQLVKFWPSCAPMKGFAAGQKFLVPPYYSQHTVFASPPSAFFIAACF